MISPIDFITDPQWTLLVDTLGTKALPQRLGLPSPVILIDGPSGTGKTTLAHALAEVLSDTYAERWQGSQIISMDAFYPGWQGLASGQNILVQDILTSPTPSYLSWDWENDCTGAAVNVDPTRPIIAEGCGTITPVSTRYADFSIWVGLSLSVRRGRALERDGSVFAPHWEEWLEQEQQHWQRYKPGELADFKFGEID